MVLPEAYNDVNDQKTHIEETVVQMKPADYLVAFSGQSQSYCIGLVDMVDSTKIISRISQNAWSKYYSIFINFMVKILTDNNAIPFKNGGDSILYYFPETSKNPAESTIKSIKCSLKMIGMHDMICRTAQNKKLPCIDYRISMDFGTVMIMNQNGSKTEDLIGPPVNMCSKINRHAPKNQLVIGGDLYQLVRKCHDFKFQQTSDYSIELKNKYPIYLVTRN